MSKKVDSLGRDIVLCWLCSKRLEYVMGALIFTEITLPNQATVKLHKICAKDFKENPCSYE